MLRAYVYVYVAAVLASVMLMLMRMRQWKPAFMEVFKSETEIVIGITSFSAFELG